MALKATIFKATLSISDLNRNYYEEHSLTLARHPSETDQRMMFRLVAYVLNAEEHLEYTRGISGEDEPDLWEKSLSGEIKHWIDLGQPDEKRIRQACAKAQRVSIYTYQKNAALPWYEGIQNKIQRFDNLEIIHLATLDKASIETMVDRSMKLSCTIQDDQIWLDNGKSNLRVEYKALKHL